MLSVAARVCGGGGGHHELEESRRGWRRVQAMGRAPLPRELLPRPALHQQVNQHPQFSLLLLQFLFEIPSSAQLSSESSSSQLGLAQDPRRLASLCTSNL